MPLLSPRIVHGRRYQPEWDGLRILAIAPVLWSHIGERILRVAQQQAPDPAAHALATEWIPRGFAGVHFFLVLSGFLIALPFMRAAMSATPSPSRWQFLQRRVWRLMPPYLIVITVIFAFLALTGYQPKATGSFAASSVSLADSWLASSVFLFGLLHESFPRLNPPGWSLEVEMHYYLLFALAAPLLASGAARWRMLLPALILAGFGLAVASETIAGPNPATFWVTRYLHYFLLGMLLARISMYPRTPSVRQARLWDGIALLATFGYGLCSFQVDRSLTGNRGSELLLFLCIVLLFMAVLRGDRFRRLMAMRPLSVPGGMTFSLYLLHMPLVQFLVTPFYRLFETGCAGLGLVPDRMLALAILGPALILIVLLLSFPFYLLVERRFMGTPPWLAPRTQAA